MLKLLKLKVKIRYLRELKEKDQIIKKLICLNKGET